MNPMTFLLVVCILITINAVVNIGSGFKEVELTRDVRIFQFCVGSGFAIWGWLIYFS